MPSYLRGVPGSACWNCDRATGEVAVVTIRTPTGGEAAFALCPDCYAGVYAPLADRLAGHTQAARLGGDVLVLTRPEGRSTPA